MTSVISFYGSHNSAVSLSIDGEIKIVLEVERFTNYKNGAIAQYKIVNNPLATLKLIIKYLQKKYNIDVFDTCLYLNADVIHGTQHYYMQEMIPAKQYVNAYHHQSHAAGAFYQTDYKNALIFSFDGGGNDGMFNIYLASRENSVTLLESVLNPLYNTAHFNYDLGFPYMVFGHYLKDIKLEHLPDGNLTYPGKIMGLASYGKVNQSWLPHMKVFYKMGVGGENYQTAIRYLGNRINVKFDTSDRLDGQIAYDIAATSQRAFEECFLEIAKPYMETYPDLPIGITGGCGLNIILNTRLVEEFGRDVFVGPNPNDCGISAGMLLHHLRPQAKVDLTYSGTELLDIDALGEYIQSDSNREIVDNPTSTQFEDSIDIVVNDLIAGKIIGVARGRSEHGPRALGNRSILCNPTISDMKDVLNQKVKNREWYRPFAPVVRLEDVNKYFEWNRESQWMSFCPKVREEWRNKLPAITHVDNTARVQTVTKEQNEWLYNLLTLMEEKTGIGILLNTSFNVNGKPILSTIKDAVYIYTTTDMDCLLIENTYYRKGGFR